MIQLIVVAASLVLGMFLYPILLRKVTRLVEWMYWNLKGNTPTEKTDEVRKIKKETNERPSVIGESKTKLGHDRTKTATNVENEKDTEKENTFAPETDENPAPMDEINVPLDKVENLTEEEFNADDEALELETGEGAVQASGASYDELMNAGRAIAKAEPSDKEKDEAGRILYENRNTHLFEQMMAGSAQLKDSIASVIEFHLAKRAEETAEPQRTDYPDDFENFDIDSIF